MLQLSLKFFFILLLTTFTSQSFGNSLSLCDESQLENIPTLQGGRVKPLYVHSYETIKFLTGKGKLKGQNPAKSYCLLSLNQLPDISASIQHVDLKRILDLSQDQKSEKYSVLNSKMELLKAEYFSQQEETSFKKALNNILLKIQAYQKVVDASEWKVFIEKDDKKFDWVSLRETKELNSEILIKGQIEYQKQNTDKYLLESKYVKYKLNHWALLITIISIIFMVSMKNNTVGLSFATLSIIVQLIAIILRVQISGRAPITNMYETVTFSGFGALLLAIYISFQKKEKLFLLAGLSYNICTLFMANFANGMLDSTIKPLVPVLRDNFWLSTHVTSIILSYSALALSWILANIYLIKNKMGTLEASDPKYYSELIHSCLKWGTVLLAAGIILGGVWADYSWGRFWGWDPKETWSLIVLLIYMAILHGKYTNWISNHSFIPMVAAAFMSVMMAWFGVNYILASGLHSYGFSEGGAIFLGTFFLVQILIIVFTAKQNQRHAL